MDRNYLLSKGKSHCTYLWLVSSLTGLYFNKQDNMLVFVGTFLERVT